MKRVLLAGSLCLALGAVLWWTQQTPPTPPPNAPLAPATDIGTTASASNASAPALATLVRDTLVDPAPAARDHALHTLLPRLVRLDPAAAARLALAWERGPMRDDLIGLVARAWADADLAAALAWLTSLDDAADRSLAATATLVLLASDDPAGALALGRWLDEGTGDGRLEHTVQLWTEQHPEEAAAWVRAQPSGPWRDRLLSRVIHVRAQQDPPAAATLAATGLSAGPVQDEALVTVARQWAFRDPASATTWAGTLPAGLLQNRGRAEIERVTRLR